MTRLWSRLIAEMIVLIFCATGCSAVENNKETDSAKYHIVGSSEKTNEELAAALNKPDEVWDGIHLATKYYEEKKYDQSISELKKVLSSPDLRPTTEWVARAGLGDAYEANGEYNFALEEINWQITQGPRQDVLDELNARRKRLERAMS